MMYSDWRRSLEPKYQWKAETVVRILERLDMTTDEKVIYLRQTFADMEMYFTLHPPTTPLVTP
jgi:hypothetical protein